MKKNEMDRTQGNHDNDEKWIQSFTWNTLRDTPLERLKCSCEDNIKMDFNGVGWEDVGWINVFQYWGQCWALVYMLMNIQVSWKVGNLLNSWATVSF
jgi:hypothetical protein